MARTKYQSLLKAQSSYCAGRGKKTSVTKAKTAYIKDAMKKGKSKSEATKIANKITGKCKKAGIGTIKKRKTTAKKKTIARRKSR